MSIEILAERAMSAPGVSVGTTLAMETILPSWPVFDPERPKPKPVNIFDYKRVWINLATLFRNMYNACPRDRVELIQPQEAADALYAEMETIYQAVRAATQNAVDVHYYWCDYRDLAKIYPRGQIRAVNTPKQIAFRDLMVKTVERVVKMAKVNNLEFISQYHTEIQPKTYGKTILISHYPVDLLSEHRFGTVDLLESHTGVLKNKTLWYTKFFNGKTLSILPFCALTLQVFGDDHFFKAHDNKIREAVLEIAHKGKWSWMTTKSKIRSDVRAHPDQMFASILVSMV